jgi:hypothetical protein
MCGLPAVRDFDLTYVGFASKTGGSPRRVGTLFSAQHRAGPPPRDLWAHFRVSLSRLPSHTAGLDHGPGPNKGTHRGRDEIDRVAGAIKAG